MAAEATTLPRLAVSAREAAEMLGISPDTVTRLVNRGELARVPHLTNIRIAVTELQRFVEGRPAE